MQMGYDVEDWKGRPDNRPVGCQFAPRCDHATDACNVMPAESNVTDTHRIMCWRHEEISSRV